IQFVANAYILSYFKSVAKFQIENNSYSAATGQSAGDQTNLITRSGTNKLHGDAFEYFRNDKLNARNFFALNQADLPSRERRSLARPDPRLGTTILAMTSVAPSRKTGFSSSSRPAQTGVRNQV